MQKKTPFKEEENPTTKDFKNKKGKEIIKPSTVFDKVKTWAR